MMQQSQCSQCANFKPVEPVTPPRDRWAEDTTAMIQRELWALEARLWQQAVITYRAEHFPADGVQHG